MSVKGSISAETALHWLTGFIVNDEDMSTTEEFTRPLDSGPRFNAFFNSPSLNKAY